MSSIQTLPTPDVAKVPITLGAVTAEVVMVSPAPDHAPAWGQPLDMATPFHALAHSYIPECDGIIIGTEDGMMMDLYPKEWVADYERVIPNLPILEPPPPLQNDIWYQFEQDILDENGEDLSGTWTKARKVDLPHNYTLVMLKEEWQEDCWSGYSVLRSDSPHLSHHEPLTSNRENKRRKH